jgi:pSer/pThr/pTyr-binding forkhead associated (FHA) protein
VSAKLIVQAPGAEPVDYLLDKALVTLGRDGQCDLVLDHEYVSRQHARVERAGDSQYLIEDAGSTNGTFLNGQRLEGKQPLSAGDHIDIGDLTITFLGSGAAETKVFRPIARECPIAVDESANVVSIRGRPLDARFFPEESRLLSLLISRYGRVVTREDLGTAIWGRGNFDYAKLADLVSRIRDKFDPQDAGLIEGIPGRGYKIAEKG